MATNNQRLASDLIEVSDDLRIVLSKARDITARYFDTGISEDVNKLSTDTTPVPETPFTKAQMLAAITLLNQFVAFADGGDVAKAVNRITINVTAGLAGE